MNGRPVARSLYTCGQGLPLALCITKLPGPAVPVQLEQHGARRTALWQDGTYAYVAVGEAEEGLLRAVAAQAGRQLRI